MWKLTIGYGIILILLKFLRNVYHIGIWESIYLPNTSTQWQRGPEVLMNNAHMMISRLMMEDALQFSAIMNCRHQCSWMPRPSCFIHSCFSFSPVIFHPRSFWGSLAHYISSMKVGSFIRPPLICTHSCLVRHISSPLFFWVLPVIFLPRFVFGSCPSYVIHFFWGPLVCHISSTKVGSFICPPLIARIHVSYVIFHPRKLVYSSVRRSSALLARILLVRVCLRVACCAFSDGGGCRRIRVFSSGSLTSKKLLIFSFSCCFPLKML